MKNIIIMASAILLFSACRNNADVLPTASLASVSGIKFSDTTPNPKEGKRVLVISSSPRLGGNTDLLCDEFVRGAQEAYNLGKSINKR